MRIGHGYDVHRFCDGRPLFLGGINIPFEQGLLGHSDADVLLHAVCDALLGAAALPDIGKLFPDNDAKFKGIDSKLLLKEVYNKIAEKGFKIINIDATVVAQVPKLSPHILDIRQCISSILSVDLECVNVKATTEEGLGFTGQKQGIAAHCVCLID
jgi:2-C-methyl-D-erythritol 2,4-cyclodiphosphate synthase